jgi:hypothetical protein
VRATPPPAGRPQCYSPSRWEATVLLPLPAGGGWGEGEISHKKNTLKKAPNQHPTIALNLTGFILIVYLKKLTHWAIISGTLSNFVNHNCVATLYTG